MSRWAALFGWVFLYQRGRAVALAFLVLCTVLVAMGDNRVRADLRGDAQSLAAMALSAPSSAVRQLLFDLYQRSFPRVRQEQKVAIVEIDEKSLKLVGQWPWPRDRLAALIDAIALYRPVAIGLDIYMPEADQTSPEQVATNLDAAHRPLADALSQLPSHDARLAQALQSAPTVLGAAGFNFETLSTSAGMRTVPVKSVGGDALPHLRRFPFVLASLPLLQAAAHGQALVSIDEDTVVRRIPMVAAVGDVVVPSLAMEMLRVATGSPAIDIHVDSHGVRAVGVADLVVPTQAGGDIWLHFAPEAQGARMRNMSAVDLLTGMVNGDALDSKLVLIGLTGSGLNDRRATPLGEHVPGIEIQAQVLESMLEGRWLVRPWWMKWIELGLLVAVGLMMVWKVPVVLRRASGVGGLEPGHAGWWVTGVSLSCLAGGFWLFQRHGWLFDGASMSIGFSGLMASLVSSSTLELKRENRRLAMEQQLLREQAARLAGEMEAARRIQLGSLPNAQRAFPSEKRFAIDALIEPAREVGGDLYDFFMIDPRRLCFLIGDVSGKGVPASLFMAVAKALARSLSTRMAGGPAEVVSAANLDLSRENVETIFVTLLLCVLDVDTGVLELVNAGHDAPWRLGLDGGLDQIKTPLLAGGPPLCVVEDFRYVVQRIQLLPGDRLCLVTDGITEAANGAGDLYGSGRLRNSLVRLDAASSPGAVIQQVRQDVADFVAGAEASDDLAVLVLHWIGPPRAALQAT